MVKSVQIAPLVGDGKFFKHVSSRAAYELGAGHPRGLQKDSHSRSARPGSAFHWDAEWFANERRWNFNSYCKPGDEIDIAAGDRVLLGHLPTHMEPRTLHITRTAAGERGDWLNATTQTIAIYPPENTNCAINEKALPATQVTAAFPTFNLFASRIDYDLIDPATEYSWATIQLAKAADMTTRVSHHNELTAKIQPMNFGCADWLVWMVPTAAIPAHSLMWIEMDLKTLNR